nr:hypothetical protein [Tanacetum cinerariifolium]
EDDKVKEYQNESSSSSLIPGGIGSSGLRNKSISSIRELLSSLGIGDGEKIQYQH